MREAFQVEIPLRRLFEAPTVAGLAESIEAARQAGQNLLAPPILPVPRNGDLALSFAQQRLWFFDQLEPGLSAYNIPAAVRLKGPLNLAALEQSLNEIVKRHESLRTTFGQVDGRPTQVIAPTLTIKLPVVDLRKLPASERETEVRRLATAEAQLPFDLSQGPLLRGTVLRLDDEEHVGLLTMHHIVSDGWSTGILIREMATLYVAFCAGGSSPLPALPIQYADFAHWQRQWLQGEVLETQIAYWKQQLAGAPAVIDLPTDHPRPAVQTFRGAHQSLVLPRHLQEGLQSAESPGRGDPVHDVVGGVQGLVVSLHGSGRPDRGHADRQSQPAGDRRADRILRQRAGPADGPFRQSQFSASSCGGCERSAWGRIAIRTCPSIGWSRNCT